MKVVFHSDDSSNGNGFRVIWEAIETGKFFGEYYQSKIIWCSRYVFRPVLHTFLFPILLWCRLSIQQTASEQELTTSSSKSVQKTISEAELLPFWNNNYTYSRFVLTIEKKWTSWNHHCDKVDSVLLQFPLKGDFCGCREAEFNLVVVGGWSSSCEGIFLTVRPCQ